MVSEHARKFAQGHWSFLGPGSDKKWYGTHVNKPNGEWDDVADILMLNISGFWQGCENSAPLPKKKCECYKNVRPKIMSESICPPLPRKNVSEMFPPRKMSDIFDLPKCQ